MNCVRGMLGYLFPLCRITAFRLCLEEFMKSHQSEGLPGKSREVNKPDIFAVAQPVFIVEE